MGIATVALGLAAEVLKYVNTENGRKLIVDVKNIKLEILEEEGKGYGSDDAKLETLYSRAKILIEAAQSELNLHAASK
jgi:hypothetical protein